MKVKKKLIEVALPLEAINKASAREKSIRHGHPSTLHLWWARRPLAAARAVIFAQMVDDPSENPDLFPSEKMQEKERQRLFNIIEELVQWENTTNETVLQKARDEIWASWRRACAENADHPRAKELFDRSRLPAFHDPFAGGGTLPLEAQRLGLEANASDLNPVAVLINKAMIEIPPRFSGYPPVNAKSRGDNASTGSWKGASGIAQDIRHYGEWMRDQAQQRIGHLYPKIAVTADMAHERPDLKPYVGRGLTILAWIWTRTVNSPNPAFAHVGVPLASTFMLSEKPGSEAYVEPVVSGDSYRFEVRAGRPSNIDQAKAGTKLERANFRCLLSGAPISSEHIMAQGKEGKLGARLMAVVAEGERGRVYLSPAEEMEYLAKSARPTWLPDVEFFQQALGFRVGNYGLTRWSDLFTSRQLVALTTFLTLLQEVKSAIENECRSVLSMSSDRSLESGGAGGAAYAEAVCMYLALALDKSIEGSTVQCTWSPLPSKLHVVSTFGRQAIPMTWDYAEANVFADSSGNFLRMCEMVASVLERQFTRNTVAGRADQMNAAELVLRRPAVVSTDPPYYDNVGYADLSDFFYVWLRPAVRAIYPSLFSTVAVPKAAEIVATPARHGGRDLAEQFFLDKMTQAMAQIAKQAHAGYPVTIYYAFKQVETDSGQGAASTGWETFLEAIVSVGFAITGTWPLRTERKGGFRNLNRNSLASSVLVVCRPAIERTGSATRREFVSRLKQELPQALAKLQSGNIAPVDLAQAAIGPGMAVFTEYGNVLDASGQKLTVREALTLINQVLDEALTEQEGDFDNDSRWALAWFEQHGFGEGEYGLAETLSKAKNTSVRGLEEAGILKQGRGKVRLLKPEELPHDWDPLTDSRLSVWESVHHLIRALNSGERAGAEIAAKLGAKAEVARELAYRLYVLCERRKRATEALAYNGLVQSWPEIMRLTGEVGTATVKTLQSALFEEEPE